MANDKMGKWGFTALSVILICFLLILLCLPLISCEPIPQNGNETIEEHRIEGVRNTITRESGGTVAYIYVFELEGHRYATSYSEHYLVHLASCPCHNEKNNSSSNWLETSSSSIFDW